MAIVCSLIQLYTLVVFARILLEWVRVPSEHPVGKVRSALATVVDPVLLPLRKIIPPVRMGGAALDLSPLILLVGLSILSRAVC
ncbi:MAG: YggT family protein [Acidimicrobiia bacterium]|nr:YggT family protein [Acidimicrobiia bacterium]MDH3396405.1 YggT family protein [Acidimicrobiia bacterium]